MARLDDRRQDLRQRRIDGERDHLRARHHDVGDGQVGDLDRALDHRQGVVGHQAVGLRVAQFLDEFLAALRLAGECLGDAFEPRSWRGTTGGSSLICDADMPVAGGSGVYQKYAERKFQRKTGPAQRSEA
jgi:hypothetical protein